MGHGYAFQATGLKFPLLGMLGLKALDSDLGFGGILGSWALGFEGLGLWILWGLGGLGFRL